MASDILMKFEGFMARDILMKFNSEGIGVCPICHRDTDCSDCQLVKHYQCSNEVEVCIQCKSDFVTMNDIFFRGIF